MLTTLLYLGGAIVLVLLVTSRLGRRACKVSGHQWFSVHAGFPGHVKVACGRCGDVASMPTADWRTVVAHRTDDDKRLAQKFDAVMIDPELGEKQQ